MLNKTDIKSQIFAFNHFIGISSYVEVSLYIFPTGMTREKGCLSHTMVEILMPL